MKENAILDALSKTSGGTYEIHTGDTVVDEIEVNDDLDALDQAFEDVELILKIRGFTFVARYLTPGELAEITNSLVSRKIIDALRRAKEGTPELEQATKVYNEEARKHERQIRIRAIMLAVKKPDNLEESRVSKWRDNIIDFLFMSIMSDNLSNTPVDRFPEEVAES